MRWYTIQVAIVAVSAALGLIASDFTEGMSEKLLRSGFALVTHADPAGRARVEVDSTGIPWAIYGSVGGTYIGRQRNPVMISQHALEYYDRTRQNDTSAQRLFLNCADWLRDSARVEDDLAKLCYAFPWPQYRLGPGWVSAMAQAQAMQVMIRAHRLTGRKDYLDQARRMMKLLFVPISDGGVLAREADDRWWYEEYAAAGGDSARVLNGMMYTLLALDDYLTYTGDSDAATLWYNGLNCLAADLPQYDRRGHSYYDRLGHPAGGDYHRVHIQLLDTLFSISGRPTFAQYRDRWRDYERSPFVHRLFTAPNRISVPILALNVVAMWILLNGLVLVFSRFRGRRGH